MQQAEHGGELSDEELVKIVLTERPSKGDPDFNSEVEVRTFINELKITKKKNSRVLLKVIYEKYKSWSKNPVSKPEFNLHFKKHFTGGTYRFRNYYNLDATPFEGYYVAFKDLFFVGVIYGTQVEADNAQRYNEKYKGPKKKEKPPIQS